jgi:hypothetical protein
VRYGTKCLGIEERSDALVSIFSLCRRKTKSLGKGAGEGRALNSATLWRFCVDQALTGQFTAAKKLRASPVHCRSIPAPCHHRRFTHAFKLKDLMITPELATLAQELKSWSH